MGRIVEYMHPYRSGRDALTKGRVIQGTCDPRDVSSKGRIVQGTHFPRDGFSKGRKSRLFRSETHSSSNVRFTVYHTVNASTLHTKGGCSIRYAYTLAHKFSTE
jgi:hypothetical protein